MVYSLFVTLFFSERPKKDALFLPYFKIGTDLGDFFDRSVLSVNESIWGNINGTLPPKFRIFPLLCREGRRRCGKHGKCMPAAKQYC